VEQASTAATCCVVSDRGTYPAEAATCCDAATGRNEDPHRWLPLEMSGPIGNRPTSQATAPLFPWPNGGRFRLRRCNPQPSVTGKLPPSLFPPSGRGNPSKRTSGTW
jgi:hypothetical protein